MKTGQRLLSALEALVTAAPGLPEPSRIDLPDPSGLQLDSVDLPASPHPPHSLAAAEVLDYLRTGLQAGMVLPDPADPTLATVRVTAG